MHTASQTRPIAVIGLSGRYPGGAHDVDQLWANLMQGVDGIRDLPPGRWDAGYQHPDRERKGRSYTYQGGYLESVDGFDADFFGMSPREAQQMDPQHRLLLELAWEALENAHLVPGALAGSRTGVFVGLSNRDYADLSGETSINAYTNLGLALSLASNRISYVLDLKGPSFTVDTACSSGMVALHQARLALLAGECEMALVGAANMLISPKPYIGFSKASMLSPAGRCTSFDAQGAGYVRAEGGGMLVLKDLAAAERDGDQILGLIVASGVNSDGRTVGIALPSVDAQAALLRQVYEGYGLSPDDVFYLEAHGTGTAVGDPIECEAIARVLGGSRRGDEVLRVGSIKSNIGHLEPAAGIAGLTKVLLSLKHRQIPANLHFRTPNPKIDWQGWKLQVVDQATPLPQRERPLLMGVNSFGFGGTNGHAVVQEYRGRVRAEPAPSTETPRWQQMLVLSGQSPEALAAVAAQWQPLLEQAAGQSGEQWQALRATALHHRSHHAHRLVLQADNVAQARDSLDEHLRGQASPRRAVGRTPAHGRARTAWVYGGNGPQWWGMGRQVLQGDATYRRAVEEVDGIFRSLSGWSLIDELLRDEAGSRMGLTEVAQPTLFALQVGLTTLLREAGLAPDIVFGHSVGEVAAAWASGALTLQQATQVIHHRSAAQGTTAGLGKMAALGIPPSQAQALIAEIGGFLELAAVNSPGAVTVAGDPARLAILVQRVTEAGSFARLLALDYAFHTRAMDGIQQRLADSLQGLQPGATTVPYLSTVAGHELPGSALDADYWWRNVRQPVLFEAATAQALDTHQVQAFIEIGPHPVLRDYLLQTAKAHNASTPVLSTLRRPRAGQSEPEIDTLWQTVCMAQASGLGDPLRLAERPARPVPLPTYPWQRSRHWRGENPLPGLLPPVQRDHPLLGWRLGAATSEWANHIDSHLLPYLLDHVVEDAAIFPATGYIETALAVATQLLGDGPAQVEDLDFLKPLVVSEGQTTVLRVQADAADGSFEISSRASIESGDGTLHSRGRVTRAEPGHQPAPLDIAALWQALPVAVDGAAHYRGCDRRGLRYGPAFQVLQDMRLESDEETRVQRGAAWLELSTETAGNTEGYRSHPALLDGCLQVLITLLGHRDSRPCAYIPVRVDRLRCFAPLPRKVLCVVQVGRQSERSGAARFTVYDEAGQCVFVLDNTRFQKVDFVSAGGGLRLVHGWRRDPAAAQLRAATPIDLQRFVLAMGTSSQPPAAPSFDALIGAYAADTLRALWVIAGLDRQAGTTVGGLQRRARLAPGTAPLFRALVEMAVADGWLLSSAQGLAWSTRERADTGALWRAAAQAAPGHSAELMLLAQLGETLPALLRGEAAPVLAAAGERGHAFLEALLDTAPYRAAVHKRATQAVQAWLAQWPAGRPLRVLELHAGGGGLSAAVLPLLPALRCDLTISDGDADIVERLAQRYASVPQVQTRVLKLPDETMPRGAFDLVICADGLQASGLAPALALARARALLAPGGGLLLATALPGRLSTLVFGQDPAWWHGDSSPLQDATAWVQAWASAGWSAPLTLDGDAEGHMLWLARLDDVAADPVPVAAPAAFAPTSKPAALNWLLLGDATPASTAFGDALSAALHERGQVVRRLNLRAPADEAAADTLSSDDTAGLVAALAAPTDRIVHLAGLLHTAVDADSQMALQDLRCLPLITLVQALQDGAVRQRPQLRVLTRGACMGPAADPATLHPAQTPVWGLVRVLGNEHGELAPKLIDLHVHCDAMLAARVAAELLRDDEATEVLLDAGDRWLHRALALSPAALAQQAEAWPQPRPRDAATAVRLEAAAQGGLDALHLREVPRRAPAAGEVEVAVRAAGLNFRDVLWAMNMLPEEAVEAGFSGATVGMECAGEVVAVGSGVTTLKPGDRVIGFASGCFASHVTTTEGALARIPAGLDWAAAATIPTTFLTAMYALDHLARLEPGERVLIHGAAGGVGLAAVQIAKLRGAIVFGTAGNADKRRLLRLAGVDHVLDSRSLAYADDVMALTQGQGVDVVLNSLAGEAITKNLQILRPFGRMLEIGKRDFYANSRIGLRPFRQNLSYFGIDADTLLIERPDLAHRVFRQVAELFAQGKLHALPHQALPIARAPQAFRLMQQSRHVGKIVIVLPAAGEAPPRGLPATWAADPQGTWLVTGGLGGFGLASARWLVAQGARHVALLGRRGATTDEARAGVAALQAAGAQVRAHACDVSVRDDLARVLAEVRAKMPPLRGVLHSAMVLDDGPLLGLDAQRLQRVLAPKLMGAWHLHELTRADVLQAFIVYSSATTVVGNPGQASYVAANLYLESLVQLRRAQGLPGLAMAWGAIQDVGVLTRHAGVDKILQQRTGMSATPAEQALGELGRMLAADASVVSVAQFNLQRVAELLPIARTPRFAALVSRGAGDAGAAGRLTLAERLPATPLQERRPLVADTLREHLGRILGTAAGKIDLDRPLPELGLDSLMAVELAQSLEGEVGRTVSVMQMIQASSASAVAELLLAGFETPAAA